MINSEQLDSTETVNNIDPNGMLLAVSRMPEMVAQAEQFSSAVSLPGYDEVNNIVVSGLGGSAIAGDLAADLIGKSAKVPVATYRQYQLPEYVSPKTLVFALSYSGETEETISAVNDAGRKNAKIICITSGGKLKEIAEKNHYPLILIPTGYQPRAALPFLFIPLLACLDKLGIISGLSAELKETIFLLMSLREEYGVGRPARNNPAKQLAKKLIGKIPVIFGSSGITGGVALRFKTQFNENSKTTALANNFPELNHNEIVNLAALKKGEYNLALIVLRDERESERIKKRIEITKSLISRQIGGITEIASRGKSSLARLFSLIIFGDFVSVYLAIAQGIDPTPVEIISRLKKEMAR